MDRTLRNNSASGKGFCSPWGQGWQSHLEKPVRELENQHFVLSKRTLYTPFPSTCGFSAVSGCEEEDPPDPDSRELRARRE